MGAILSVTLYLSVEYGWYTRVVNNDARHNFEAAPSLEELIAQQGKRPVEDVNVLHGDFWPEEERIEDFLNALREWRGHRSHDRAA